MNFPFTTGMRVLPRLLKLVVICSILLSFPSVISAQEDGEQPDPVDLFNQAQDLHEKGDLKGAVLLYEKALSTLPEFPEAEYQRGIALVALNNIDGAEKAFRRAIELRPGWTLAMTRLGTVLIQREKLDEASSLLQEVINVDANNPLALTALTELRLRSSASPAVLKDLLAKLTDLTVKSKPTVSIWTAQAALEMALGQFTAAKSSLTKALSLNPANTVALSMQGDISLTEGDVEKAREIILRLEKTKEQAGPAVLLKARVLAFEGQIDDAEALLNTIKGEVPGVSDLRAKISVARSSSPETLEHLLKNNERDAAILSRLCSLYRREDPAKALEYCRRASAVEPNNISHAIGFGAALVQTRQFESAVGVLTKIIEIAPDNSTARANLATALFQLKRFPEAKTEFLWLTREQPQSAGAYYFLGILHDEMTEYMDAAANYQQYLRLADPVINKTDIERVNLRMPQIQRLIREGKGKKTG